MTLPFLKYFRRAPQPAAPPITIRMYYIQCGCGCGQWHSLHPFTYVSLMQLANDGKMDARFREQEFEVAR